MEEIPHTCDMCKMKNVDCTRGQLRGSQSCWNKIHIAWFGVILDELAQHKVVAHIVGYLNTVEHPLLAVSRDSMCNAFPDIKGTPEEGVYPYTLGFIRNFSDKRVTWVNQDDEYLYLDFVSGADAALEMERSSDQITSFVGDNYMKGTTAHQMFMIDPQSDFMGSLWKRSKKKEAAVSDKTITPKDLLISILEECLSVSDEWGGSKLANWQYGHNVLVEGIDDAAQRIIDEMLLPPPVPGTASDACQDLMKAIQDINVTVASIRKDTKEFNKTSKILGKGI